MGISALRIPHTTMEAHLDLKSEIWRHSYRFFHTNSQGKCGGRFFHYDVVVPQNVPQKWGIEAQGLSEAQKSVIQIDISAWGFRHQNFRTPLHNTKQGKRIWIWNLRHKFSFFPYKRQVRGRFFHTKLWRHCTTKCTTKVWYCGTRFKCGTKSFPKTIDFGIGISALHTTLGALQAIPQPKSKKNKRSQL